MAIRKKLRLTALVSTAALVSLALSAGTALSKTKPADLRVVTSSGVTLAEYTQYTGSTTAKADKRATCFGEDNPSSNRSYELKGSSPLSALIDASDHDSALDPLRLTDAFVDDGFGFGVCRIGDYSFSPVNFTYWYNATNYTAGSTGPDLIKLHDGDHVLWYLTNGSEPNFPNELELKVQARAKTNDDVTVTVIRHLSDGSTQPAQGVTVAGAAEPTNAQGRTTVTPANPGRISLQATGLVDDVPSNTESLCVAGDISDCPAVRGQRIFGSALADEIDGSKGKDKIGAGRGGDTIDVHTGGPDKVTCGSGKDNVIRAKRQPGLVLKGCEKVTRRSS